MSQRSRVVRGAALAGAMALGASAAALDPQRFVAGWPIDAPAGAEVFDVPLTVEVYAAASNVEQLAVLDVNGAPLSFFRRSVAPPTSTEQRTVLEASPLYADGAARNGAVGVTTNANGTSVTVTPGAASSPAVAGFVLDARAIETAPVAIELDWRALPQPFLLDVSIEQSTNLSDWRGVGRASVAALLIGGAEARHARVPVRANAGGYYRVTANRAVADWHLLRAALVSAAAEAAVPLSVRVPTLAASARPADAAPGALYFDAGAALPVAAVTLGFAAGGGWVRAGVAASRSLDGPWTAVVYDELFYSLAFEGAQFASTPVMVGRQEARYWRIVPSAPLRDRSLDLTLLFPQEYLRVAAGAAPYLLAAGTLAEEAGPDATFSSVWSALTPVTGAVPLAVLGTRRELGGPAALVAPWVFPWRTAALWTVLAGGVLVVGTMAVRLAREMRSKPS